MSHHRGFDTGIISRARRSGARLVMRPGHAPLHKTPLPFTYGLPVQPQLGRHFLVLTTFRAGQHDPGSQGQRLRCLPPHRQRPQFGSLIIAQYQGGTSPDRHRIVPSLFASILGIATRIYCESTTANV
jgi:hypothetical protein